MRIRLALVLALLMTVAVPAQAKERSEPFHVRQANEVGRAAATNSINGIYVSPVDGNIYAASVGGDEITVHHPRNGKVLDRIGPERGVHGPDDVFVADDGTVYWTEILTGNVGMLRPDGTFAHQLVGQGVNPITMSDDGRLFVARLFFGQGLYELDPNLIEPPKPVNPDLQINAFDFGPDGYLYAPAFFGQAILKVDVDTGASEVVADGFRVPSSVKFNSLGEPYAVDLAEGQVWKLDLAGGNHEAVLDIEGTIDNMAFGPDDRMYVAAGADNQIILKRNDADRPRALSRPGIGLPGGVAVSPGGSVWVAEFFVLRGFPAAGQRYSTTSFYDRFDPPGRGFAGAATVAADGDNLITSSGFSNSVIVMDPDTGAILLDVRSLATPTNAIRHDGMLVATQLAAGNVVNAEDPSQVVIDGLAVPLGLASDGETLFVGDWALGNVWAVDGNGTRPVADGLKFPEGLAVDGDRLLVVETGAQQVTAIDLATGAKSTVIVGLDFTGRTAEGFFPYGMMSGVAIGADDSIYVSDDGVNKVYRFRRNFTLPRRR